MARFHEPMLDYLSWACRQEQRMSEETISVRIPSEKKAYLDLHAWQRAHIGEGLRQADAGEFASEAEVRAAFARWRS
jgi:predicted transcriptional regulator